MAERRRNEQGEHAALIRSRRRCCVCFGLHDDLGVKQGQIAHLDRDRSNSSPGNLVFLCLEHHDQYDTRTSQSKSLQMSEVKDCRAKLDDHFARGGEGAAPSIEDPQPDWDRLSAKQKNILIFDGPHRCSFCGYSFSLVPRLEPGTNVYAKTARCPKCGNTDEVNRMYEA